MLLPLLLTCAAAVGSSPGASVSGEDPFTRGEVRELVLARRPGQVEEYFRLDLSPAAGGADEVVRGQVPVGLARWTRGPLSAETSGWRTACDVLLHAERTRVHHTERLTDELRELVFREVPPLGGRTVYLAWTPDGTAISSETVGVEARRREFDLAGGGLPLSLVELARHGETWSGPIEVFRPLSNDLERWSSELSREPGGRVLEIREPGGRVVGTYRFRGDRLVSFRWQAGGLVATAIPADEYERWEHAMPIDPPSLASGTPTPYPR